MRIAVAQRKGGVGKTVSARELAVALCSMGREVLAVDLDSQHNLTDHFNVRPRVSITGVLMGTDVREAVVRSEYGPSVIGSDAKLASVELGMAIERDNTRILLDVLEPVLSDFEFVFYDAPANLGLLAANAVVASDLVVAPVDSQGLDAVTGLKMLSESIAAERPIATIQTIWQTNRKLSREIEATLRELGFPNIGRVPRLKDVATAAYEGPVCVRRPDSPPAFAYRDIAKTLIDIDSQGGLEAWHVELSNRSN